ncbi:MAG: 4Fe-4S ferredoxin [Candidatus Adiutrix sp.]|nr:4Fe-4S ferredoxin [Candidatus Adiutrix sp.]
MSAILKKTENEVRDIIEINEELCDGCGRCLTGCAEGALALVDGKARLVSDVYCDGLGACLGHCPTGALKVIRRSAPAFEDHAAGLSYWPIQLRLVSPQAPAFDRPVLTLAADCSAFTGPAFHRVFLTEAYPLVRTCPKFDEAEPQIDRLAAILTAHPAIEEIRAPMMSVPCCGALAYIATQAVKKAGREGRVRLRLWLVSPRGQVSEEDIR